MPSWVTSWAWPALCPKMSNCQATVGDFIPNSSSNHSLETDILSIMSSAEHSCSSGLTDPPCNISIWPLLISNLTSCYAGFVKFVYQVSKKYRSPTVYVRFSFFLSASTTLFKITFTWFWQSSTTWSQPASVCECVITCTVKLVLVTFLGFKVGSMYSKLFGYINSSTG